MMLDLFSYSAFWKTWTPFYDPHPLFRPHFWSEAKTLNFPPIIWAPCETLGPRTEPATGPHNAGGFLYNHQGTLCSLWQVCEHLDYETWECCDCRMDLSFCKCPPLSLTSAPESSFPSFHMQTCSLTFHPSKYADMCLSLQTRC